MLRMNSTTTLSDSRPARWQNQRWSHTPENVSGVKLRPRRVSPDYLRHPSNVPCPLPRRIKTGASVDCFPVPCSLPRFSGGSASASPFRGLLRLHSHYGPLDRSTAVMPEACPRNLAAFVAGLRRGRLPDHAARQLPDQSTTPWVEPASTGDTRLRGALKKKKPAFGKKNGAREGYGICKRARGFRAGFFFTQRK